MPVDTNTQSMILFRTKHNMTQLIYTLDKKRTKKQNLKKKHM